MGAVQTCTSTQ